MLERGGVRLLTQGEIRLAMELFRNQIQYNRVWIHHGSYLPFDMQQNNTAMTPNGEMWFEKNIYREDYSSATIEYKYVFMHEMMHVWQYQHGMNVRMRGLMSWAVDYSYNLDKPRLSSYSMEQQASIVADYWLLNRFAFLDYQGISKYKRKKNVESVRELKETYRSVIGCFP